MDFEVRMSERWMKPGDLEVTDLSGLEERVDVWRVLLGPNSGEETLAADEWERADRFRAEGARQRFVARRICLRRLIGAYLGVDPGRVEFEYGPYGKPSVAKDLQFNLSHSDDRLLIAATKAGPVGVDIERIDPEVDVDFDEWTRREAVAKAHGAGFSLPDDFPVGESWLVRDLAPEPGYVGAVAVMRP